jgi:hypothetical protein|tara:strand:+ start:4125 stop:4523 length:399 start_codon:yes stop_codon:yes gene_type:complete
MNTESVKLFTLDNLYITGEKSLNFIIKNKLSLYTNNKSQSLLDIKINLLKKRGVKEKKSNNKVNKYSISLNFSASVIEKNTGEKFNFNKTNISDFVREPTVINTKKNEEYKLKILAEQITEEFVDFLNTNLQ